MPHGVYYGVLGSEEGEVDLKSGYTKAWRRELSSDIWKMPPMYHRVFFFLRQKSNWDTKILPTTQVPKMGIWVSPGTLITSYDIIAEGVSYIEHGVERVPNRKTIMTILDWLQDRGMIKKESNIRGTILYIINWDTYQSQEDEKVTRKKQSADIKMDNEMDDLLDTTKTLIPLERSLKKDSKDNPQPIPKIKAKKEKKPLTDMPDDFCVSERVLKWASEKGHGNLEEHLESFKRKVAAKSYQYADWDAAFMEAIRENWAKIGSTGRNIQGKDKLSGIKSWAEKKQKEMEDAKI